jgi:PIN domain nuclease of toxin-antitoxin system
VGPALNLLLDTAVVIWATATPERLSTDARAALEARRNSVFVSAASAWEVGTKFRRGRLDQAAGLVDDWVLRLAAMGYVPLDITAAHGLRGGGYDIDHGDPFDRIIAAQAELEGMTLVASDRAFDLFPVQRLW